MADGVADEDPAGGAGVLGGAALAGRLGGDDGASDEQAELAREGVGVAGAGVGGTGLLLGMELMKFALPWNRPTKKPKPSCTPP